MIGMSELISQSECKNFFEDVLKLDEKIRYVAIYDGEYHAKFRDGVQGYFKEEEKQKLLFKKFYQADTSLRREHGGTGLGLSICKGIIEGLGGEIFVNSVLGGGTSFHFILPKK